MSARLAEAMEDAMLEEESVDCVHGIKLVGDRTRNLGALLVCTQKVSGTDNIKFLIGSLAESGQLSQGFIFNSSWHENETNKMTMKRWMNYKLLLHMQPDLLQV